MSDGARHHASRRWLDGPQRQIAFGRHPSIDLQAQTRQRLVAAEKTVGAMGPCLEPFELLTFFPKAAADEKAFVRRLALCPEGYNICFAVVEMLRSHKQGQIQKDPSARPMADHARNRMPSSDQPQQADISRLFRRTRVSRDAWRKRTHFPHADRTLPRNRFISDLSRWLSLVSACAAESTCEEAEPVSLAPR